VTARRSSNWVFKRFIHRKYGTEVRAMVFPEAEGEELAYLRKLWKQPKANPGDVIVRPTRQNSNNNHGPYHILMPPEQFGRSYRLPE
jgi:hypothetical protein